MGRIQFKQLLPLKEADLVRTVLEKQIFPLAMSSTYIFIMARRALLKQKVGHGNSLLAVYSPIVIQYRCVVITGTSVYSSF